MCVESPELFLKKHTKKPSDQKYMQVCLEGRYGLFQLSVCLFVGFLVFFSVWLFVTLMLYDELSLKSNTSQTGVRDGISD